MKHGGKNFFLFYFKHKTLFYTLKHFIENRVEFPLFFGITQFTTPVIKQFNYSTSNNGTLSDRTLPRPYLNSCLEDPVGHFNGLLETDSSDRKNPRSEP